MKQLGRACLALVFAGQVVLWLRAAAWYPRLPERFPIHFDIAGKADGWAAKSAATWFLLPGVSLAMTVLLVGLGLGGIRSLARHAPWLINVPRKERFLKLSADGRVAVMRPMLNFLAYVAVLETGLFLWIVEGTGRVATGSAATLAVWPVFIFLAGVLGVLPIGIVATIREIERVAVDEISMT